jgi:hypothetical protein
MTMKKNRLFRDKPLVVPIPCSRHRKYGGKRAPTSGCSICEVFYIERRRAVQDVKASLRLLDRYGAIEVEEDGTMKIKTPEWMKAGAVSVPNESPDRVRHLDGDLKYPRIYSDHGYTASDKEGGRR